MDFLRAIQNCITDHHLIPAEHPVVVGVSGGADSVALIRIFSILNVRCSIAHLNHQLRGAESDRDERFVRDLAKELNIPITVRAVNVKALAAASGQSVEMAARAARHEFFGEFDSATIALAHHADDQAETFLLKLARGAGTEGLSGMSLSQTIDSLTIIRPMLETPRSTITNWLKSNHFTWREDASNMDENFLRNKIRHTILPLLENELNPNIRATILRTMNILHHENEWMNALPKDNAFKASKRRNLRKWLFDHGATHADFEAVEKILELMEAGNGTTIYELNREQRVIIEYGIPRFETLHEKNKKPQWKLSISPNTGWQKDTARKIGDLPAEASFSAAKIGDSEIAIRSMRKGDRMTPLGMNGSRKLQDIFTDLKVPKNSRSTVPVITCRNEIIWIPGFRISQGWEVPTPSEKSIRIRIEQNPKT